MKMKLFPVLKIAKMLSSKTETEPDFGESAKKGAVEDIRVRLITDSSIVGKYGDARRTVKC